MKVTLQISMVDPEHRACPFSHQVSILADAKAPDCDFSHLRFAIERAFDFQRRAVEDAFAVCFESLRNPLLQAAIDEAAVLEQIGEALASRRREASE